MMNRVEEILKQRGSKYGVFKNQALISQELKNIMKKTGGWTKLSASQKESLEMIVHKISRILNGDPNYDDSWGDIAGYAELIVKELKGQKYE